MFYDRFRHIHGEALGCWTMKFDFISHTHTLSLSFHAPVLQTSCHPYYRASALPFVLTSAWWKASMNCQQSPKPLYSGAGATRTTSGILSSTTMPCSSKCFITPSNKPSSNFTLICEPLSSGALGVNIAYGRPRSTSIGQLVSKYSKYAVTLKLFSLSLSMPTSLKRLKDAITLVQSNILGLLICHPLAPAIGTNRFSIRNRLSFSLPHHPLKRLLYPNL